MRIRPRPTILKIGIFLGALFTAGCADSVEQKPLTFGSVQIADRGDHHATTNRASQIWMRVASQALENGHPDTAIRFAKKAVLAAPESDEPLQVLAQAYRQKNHHDKAGTTTPHPMAMPSAVVSTSDVKSRKRGTNIRSVVTVTNNEDRENAKFVSFTQRMRSSQPVVPKAVRLPTYRIQLAAYVDLDDAVRGKTILTRRLPNDFPRLGIFVRHRPKTNDNRVNFRLRSRDLINRSQAMAFCKVVNAAGVSCLPIRQTSGTWQLVKTDMTLQAARDARPGPKSDVHVRADVAKPVTKPVAVTASPSPVNAALTGPAAGPTGPLFRIQLAAYRDFARALLGKQILTNSLPNKFPRLKFSK